jgi:non-ribosomal peptide synthetase component F
VAAPATSLAVPVPVPCLHELFEAAAARTPEAPAVVLGGSGEPGLTYRQLNEAANDLAHRLRASGVGPESVVALYCDHSPAMIVAIWGTLKAGASYVPLDPRAPEQRLAVILDEARADCVAVSKPGDPPAPVRSRRLVPVLLPEGPRATTNPPPVALPQGRAMLLFTSGSTGKPKGVELSHECLASEYFSWESAYRLRAGVVNHCQTASFPFGVFQADVIRANCSGGI